MRPSLVIIAARTDGIIETPTVGIRDPATGAETHAPDAKSRLWERGLAETLKSLASVGVPTIVVHPVPAIPTLPTACTTSEILTGGCNGTIRRDAADVRLRRSI